MRILVDESLPRRLAAEIPGHDVIRVRQQGWLGLSNGVLLRAAESANFQVLLTADRSVPFQQNLQSLGLAVIIMRGRNRFKDLHALVPEVISALNTIQPGEVVSVGGS